MLAAALAVAATGGAGWAGCRPRSAVGAASDGAGAAPGVAPVTLEDARARKPRAGLFTGCYDSSFGPMLLLENTDGSVLGSYVHHDGELLGRIEGEALIFRWREKDTGAMGSGFFVPRPDGNGVVGRWGSGDSVDDGGAWAGVRFSSDVAGCR